MMPRDPGDECDGDCCQSSESSRVVGSQVNRNAPVASMEGDLSDDGHLHQWADDGGPVYE